MTLTTLQLKYKAYTIIHEGEGGWPLLKIKKYVSVQCAEDAIMSINEQNQDRQDRTRSLTLKLKFLPLTFALCMQSNSESVFCTSSPSTTTGLRKDLHLLLPPTPPFTLCPNHTLFQTIFFFLVEMVNLGLVYININLITLDHSKN